MLTFENVLEVFADYLQEDTNLDIVLTKRGYTVMCWDNALADWSTSDFCATPEKLRDILVDSYMIFTHAKMTGGTRNLTPAEEQEIQSGCEKYRRLCDEISKWKQCSITERPTGMWAALKKTRRRFS